MPEFISKLQYKTCEDGEYYDEKVRDLQETIELINNFPWAREQYADVDLTGPSITINDEAGNYLKAGIYFGGKYSLYYFDAKRNYYEKKNVNIDFVYDKVNEFFAGKIDMQNFEKNRFAIGLKRYFVTNPFEYCITFMDAFLLTIFWDVWFIMFAAISIIFNVLKPIEPFGLIPLTVMLFLGGVLFHIFERYYKKRNQYLRISRGNAEVLFGDSKNDIKIYNKAEIEKILHYVDNASRSPNLCEVFEIVFKDGTSIVFSNMLISDSTLMSKFSDKWHLSLIRVEQNIIKTLKALP